ncbi:MAG: AMP-binding protein [Bacteroidota bacterium]
MMKENLVDLISGSIQANWEKKAFSNYGGDSVTYQQVAEKILQIHLIFDVCQVKPGDKIALLGKNSYNWAITYLATVSYGAVIVPVLPDFKPQDVHHILNHSDSVMLFAADNLHENLDKDAIPEVKYHFCLSDFSKLTPCKMKKVNQKLNDIKALFESKYPQGLKPADFAPMKIPNENLAVLSYTSGTTGFTKGVMLPHNSLVANIIYANKNMPLEPGDNIVSFLPLAHAYGCAFEFLWPFTLGCHITFLTRTPSPQIILKAFKEIKPRLVLSVPLVIEKIYKKQILPVIRKSAVKIMLKIPGIRKIIENKIRNKLMDAFGHNFHEIVIGGAPLNEEVERFFKRIKFPFSIGYGMTECGPLISYANWDKTRLGSAGKIVDTLEVKIDSEDPYLIAGEILVRGENVMKGYYKNPEATQATLQKDGWMHTGDLGLIDKDDFIYIKGRSKSMILGPSGQNIYPEEIEAKFNNMPYVQECLVVENNGQLTAIIYPEFEQADKKGFTENDLKNVFESHRKYLNKIMPAFMNVSKIRIFEEEFEKTPKKSIKRYLYNQTD